MQQSLEMLEIPHWNWYHLKGKHQTPNSAFEIWSWHLTSWHERERLKYAPFSFSVSKVRPLVKSHHLWLPSGRRGKYCGVVALSEIGHNPNKLDLKNPKRIKQRFTARVAAAPNSFADIFESMKHLQCRTTGALKTNVMNFLAVSVIKQVFLCWHNYNFASGTTLILKLSLCECR